MSPKFWEHLRPWQEEYKQDLSVNSAELGRGHLALGKETKEKDEKESKNDMNKCTVPNELKW